MQIRLNLNNVEVPQGTRVQEVAQASTPTAKSVARDEAAYIPPPDLVRYQQALAAIPDVREDLVATLKTKLEKEGTLPPNPVDQIANKILSSEFWPPLEAAQTPKET